MSAQEHLASRSIAVDAAKTAAIFGTLLIHASAMGGFAWAVGSANWVCNLAWSSVLRCAVPVFFLCSGALLLPPEKEMTTRAVWRKYIPRIFIALLFWAAVYAGWDLFLGKLRTGVVELTALRQAGKNLLRFNHKNHLYYLHVILLVYAMLPVTRFFAAKADWKTLRYALAVWFVLGSVYPLLRAVSPLSAVVGIPTQYVINLTWGAVGYGLLGHVLTKEAGNYRPSAFVWVYLAGFALTFGGTLIASLRADTLVQSFLQGTAPGVCLQAVGIYGFCVSAFSKKKRWPVVETVSKASFCIYLVHMILLDYAVFHGISAAVYAPAWSVPCLSAAAFLFGLAVWLVLRRLPLINRYLI